jgi:hypothetical protein
MKLSKMNMNRRNLLSVLLLAMTLAACEPSLQATPHVPRSLAGNWITDPGRCSAIESQLKAALDVAKARELHDAIRRSARRARVPGEAVNLHADPSSWELREQEEQYGAMLEMLRPAPEFSVSQSAGQIGFVPAHAAHRNFEPGTSSTLITEFAHLHVISRWQNDEFVVSSKDGQNGIAIEERYKIRPDHSLLMSLVISIKYMETQQYSLVYHKQ